VELVGLGSYSSMESFASSISWQRNGEGRNMIGDATSRRR